MYLVQEVADRFRVTRRTVLSWIASGRLKAIDVSRAGCTKKHYRITEEAIAAFEGAVERPPEVSPELAAARARGIKEYI